MLKTNLAVRIGLFSDTANTPDLESNAVNQPEHVDIYGFTVSLSLFQHRTNITLVASYSYGQGGNL